MNKNIVILIGRLGKNPEMSYTAKGTAVTKFSVATNSKFGDVEKTAWHNIVTFGKLAELCNQYLVSGQEAAIEGRIDYSSWDKDDGTKGYKTEIVADKVDFGSKPNGAVKQAARSTESEEISVIDDEIPF